MAERATEQNRDGSTRNGGFLSRVFKLAEHGTSVRREIVAGLTTFAAMAYILAVNPNILAAAGMDVGAVLTATALASAMGWPCCFCCTRFFGECVTQVCVTPLHRVADRSSLRGMSRLPFEMMLALRYLRPKRTFVSVITLISIVGVTLGVAVLIIVISVMTGFDRELREKILGFNAHLRIQRDNPMENFAEAMHLIESNPELRGIIKGVAPYVLGQVMVQTQPEFGNSQVIFPVVRGIEAKREAALTVLLSSIVDGTNEVRGDRVLVGREFAMKMDLHVGDRLAIYSVRHFERFSQLLKKKSEREESDEAFLPHEFEISGIFDVGFYDFNDLFIACSLANAQELFFREGEEDAVHGLMVMLHDPEQARLVRQQLGPLLGSGYYIRTWEEENESILDALMVEKNMMFYLLSVIMVVAAFGIMSTLITFVVQKTREIGILKALGAFNSQIMFIFLSQGLLVGVIGVSLGLGGGILAVWYRNEFLKLMRGVTGFELFPAKIYYFRELPALIDPSDIAVICGVSLIACLVAGLVPAWIAGRLRPVDALRHE